MVSAKVKVLSRGLWIAYPVSALSFIITLFLLPAIAGLVTPYITINWLVKPGTYLVAWAVATFIMSNLLYLIISSITK